jgi:tetratricopeptide (TPR) repeat protein
MDLVRTNPGVPAAPLAAATLDVLLTQVLAARRGGTLPDLIRQRPRAARWLVRRYLDPILSARGESAADERAVADAVGILLRWGAASMRPDRAGPHLAGIEASAWLDRTSWRPLLALACHFELLAVPDFPQRYHRHSDEPAVDNLCGLWSVGTSTFYRYLDKGRRQLAEFLSDERPAGRRRLALREAALASLGEARARADKTGEPDGRDRDAMDPRAWHGRQAEDALARRDPAGGLWHLLRAGDAGRFVSWLMRHRAELAGDDEIDALIESCASSGLARRHRFDLQLAHATLWLTRGNEERARTAYDEALSIASLPEPDPLLLGIVTGALGKFHESRDTDKALACFQDSSEHLRRAAERDEAPANREAMCEYVASLQRLAWHYVLRNDPRSRAVLDRAQTLRLVAELPEETVALLEQAWGEYWRRAGDFRRAVEHQHRVLNVFERLRDRRQTLSTYNNLSLTYIEASDFDRAVEYAGRVRQAAEQGPVEPYLLASAMGNHGIALFSQGRYDEAIVAYEDGLRVSLDAHLPVLAKRARFNLAEASYKRFQRGGDPEDERRGDAQIAALMAATASDHDPLFQKAVPSLKAEILGPQAGVVHDRLWTGEAAEHFEEMSLIERQRTALALPMPARERVRAHLAIANAYLAISAKEREAAIALIREHGLGAEFEAEIDALHMTFSRELTREKVLLAQWKQKSYGVLTEERASVVLKQVLEAGSINKSGYAQLCQVGLATASKHLGTLAERGLLMQMGKGPSTRYVLPA